MLKKTKEAVKLVHISTVGITGTKLLLPQCSYFRSRGFDVSFIFSPGPEAQQLRDEGFAVEELEIDRRINALRDLESIAKLRSLFSHLKPDIVHTHTSKAGLVGRIAARLAHTPIVVHTVHGFPFYEGMLKKKALVYQSLERFGASFSSAIFSQSAEDVENAKQLGIRSRTGDLVHIGNGIDIEKFNSAQYSETDRAKIKRRLGLKPETLVLTTIARINPVKGYPDLINAAARLPKTDWCLLCIGEDEGQVAEIRSQIEKLSLDGKIKLLGQRDDVRDILSITNIYILPSYKEGVPRSVIEAQAMKIPAVVTNIRGSREIVLDGRTGFIVPPHNPEALANAVGKLIEDQELRAKFGDEGRKRIEECFDESQVFERIANEYELLLRKYSLSHKRLHYKRKQAVMRFVFRCLRLLDRPEVLPDWNSLRPYCPLLGLLPALRLT